MSINSLLPRPPPAIRRNSNIDRDADEIYGESKSNTQHDYDDLLNNNEHDEEKNDYLEQIDEAIVVDTRRSTRPRTKTRRIYSPEIIEDPSYITNKKKKMI